MDFNNAYEDPQFAQAYSKLEFPGTYYLAYRDLPEIIRTHVRGNKALDFGCGAGRSSRFLATLGFQVVGVDISPDMITIAKENDPGGQYHLIMDGNFDRLDTRSFDLIFSAFTFDNIPTAKKKCKIFKGLQKLLGEGGRLVNLVSTPEIYTHEWASFSTKYFPENQNAKDGDIVKIINTAIGNATPVKDILWTDRAYQTIYLQAGLKTIGAYKPLAHPGEPYPWINETRIPPWCIYVLHRQ